MAISEHIKDREQAKFQEIAGQTTVRGSSPLMISRIDKVGNTTYVGEAAVGSLPSQAVWRISRIVSAGNATTVFYASSGLFDQIWDNRAGLIYG
jgi:hypothetical protein